jgi:cobalt-zinc-cadmium efflux system membrane fusion protein
MKCTNGPLRICLITGLWTAAVFALSCTREGSADIAQTVAPQKQYPAEVRLPVAQQSDGTIEIEEVKTSEEPELIQAAGKITFTDRGTWRVGVLTTGRIETVIVGLGDFVRKGEILARMHSHDVHEARAAYQSARADLSRAESAAALAQKNYERAERLYSLKAGSLGELEMAKQELVNAQTAVRNEQVEVERERIHLEGNLGVVAEPAPGTPEEEAEQIAIRAPGTGYVLTKNVTPGTVVDASKELFVIGNLSRVWMIASVGQSNIAKLQVGQTARVTTAAFASEQFSGKVTNLAAELDPVTRVMQVRIEMQNPSTKLRPEMLANAQIQVGGMRSLLLVQSQAVQQVNDQDVIFVRTAEDRFEVRPVRVGESINGKVRILEGLKPGDAIVTKGSFILKSQLLKSSIEGD